MFISGLLSGSAYNSSALATSRSGLVAGGRVYLPLLLVDDFLPIPSQRLMTRSLES